MTDDHTHLSLAQASILRQARQLNGGASTNRYGESALYRLEKLGLMRQISTRYYLLTARGREIADALANAAAAQQRAQEIASGITYRSIPATLQSLAPAAMRPGVWRAVYDEAGAPGYETMQRQLQQRGARMHRYSNAGGCVEVLFEVVVDGRE